MCWILKDVTAEDGSGNGDGGQQRVRGVMGAPRKTLCYNDLTLFRVGIFITLKNSLIINIQRVTRCVYCVVLKKVYLYRPEKI